MNFGTWPGIKNPFSCSVFHTREDVRESVADAAAICANAPAGVGTASDLPLLVNSFMKMPGADVILFMAGFPECSQTAESLGSVATLEPRLRLELRFIRKDEVQLFFKSADLIVLPYREILNSGVALLALSFNRPVLVPAIGALPELQALVGAEWVRCYSGHLTPEKLDAALGWALYANRSTAPCLEGLDWVKLARETLLAYESVASSQWGTARRKSGGICARALRTRG
jgi:hypothetical protein